MELPIAERLDVALELLPTLATDDLLAMFAELLLYPPVLLPERLLLNPE